MASSVSLDDMMASPSCKALVKTIQKLEALAPVLGMKWKVGMLRHYYETLADVVLYEYGKEDADSEMRARLLQSIRCAVTVERA